MIVIVAEIMNYVISLRFALSFPFILVFCTAFLVFSTETTTVVPVEAVVCGSHAVRVGSENCRCKSGRFYRWENDLSAQCDSESPVGSDTPCNNCLACGGGVVGAIANC